MTLYPLTDDIRALKGRLEDMLLSWPGVLFVSLNWLTSHGKFGVLLGVSETTNNAVLYMYSEKLRELEWVDPGLIFTEKGTIGGATKSTQRAQVP